MRETFEAEQRTKHEMNLWVKDLQLLEEKRVIEKISMVRVS